ncbi:MAG TPA: polyprenyl synthetase family protein [Candidatus Omnitrophota bacterium]|nr:polyprenyl synthetase family protein [Candidatus Omnitrophota bacterium]HPD84361.1 polyprenyl synthetase family protein [Candidatus Omnitrophota bacterium]HRZ03219.1 polyprenyl synthetase family protein [Candidatus Omnitrophota bacterium]
MIERIKKHIDVSLGDFLKRIKREYKLHLINPILFESIKDFTLRKGKRIRPLLLILSYQGYSKNKGAISRKLYNASTCIEFLHNFMLIHDDIIDRSDLRRGKPTMHKLLAKAVKTTDKERLGYDLSIVAGDIVYAMAIDAFLSIDEAPKRKEEALKYFIQTAAFTAMGEFIDIIHGVDKIENITEKDIFLNYTLKTARYTFACPLVIGAILAGAKPDDIRKLSQLGIMIGQAFQIQDDILGVFGSEKAIGKSVLSDIEEFKKTILVCRAYRKLSPKRRTVFMRYFSKTKKSYHDLAVIREFLIESQSLTYSLKKIKSLLGQARTILGNVKMKDPYRKLIADSLQSLFKTSDEIAQTNGIDFRIM